MTSKAEDIKRGRVEALLSLEDTTFIRFRGAPLVSAPGTHGFVPLDGTRFAPIAYQHFGMGISKGSIADLQHAIEQNAPDWTDTERYIAFNDEVWDTRSLDFAPDQMRYVYSTHIRLNRDPSQIQLVHEYLLSLADGDEALAHDYLQLIAPMFMFKKPVGIIWLLGAGANGKSSFINAIYRVFGKHLASLTTEMIEDGRATPSLRGVLGNVVRESSERRVEDTQRYKNIGAHEPFPVRLLGTHDVITVETNFHTLFNANNLPVFADKTMGSRRRTILIPFPATFKDNPNFDDETFTPEFLGALFYLVLEETKKIAEHGYQWSAASMKVQAQYNDDANTAEAFARYIDELGVVAFKNYHILRLHYETWCSSEGTVALGRTALTKGIEAVLKPVKIAYRDEGNISVRHYFVHGHKPESVEWLNNGYAMSKEDTANALRQLELSEKAVNEW